MERYPSVTTLRILDSRVSSSLEDKNTQASGARTSGNIPRSTPGMTRRVGNEIATLADARLHI